MGKRTVFILVLALFCRIGYGQKNIDRLFNELAGQENVTRVCMGKFMMKCAGLFTDVMGVDGIDILSFESCGPKVKERLEASMKDFRDSGYETMVQSNEKGERTKVLVRIKDEQIRELVVLTTGDSPALVRIRGKIKKSDIERMVN